MEGQQINDEILLQAMRRRMHRDLESKNGGATPITQNFYGGGGGGMGGGGGGQGMMEGGGEPPADPRDMQYLVDIVREDIEPGDTYDAGDGSQRTAKRKGWRKQVHRFVVPKKKTEMDLGE
jgi:hypothetical protein